MVALALRDSMDRIGSHYLMKEHVEGLGRVWDAINKETPQCVGTCLGLSGRQGVEASVSPRVG